MYQYTSLHRGKLIPYQPLSVSVQCLLIYMLWEGVTEHTPIHHMGENKSTKTWSYWGGKEADLSKEKGQEPVPQWVLLGSVCTGIQVKLISYCQAVTTIDNLQRTTRAYSESGSVRSRAIKLWGTNSFHAWTHVRKLRAFLAKQVSQDFMYSFLGLIAPGEPALSITGLHHPLSLFQA